MSANMTVFLPYRYTKISEDSTSGELVAPYEGAPITQHIYKRLSVYVSELTLNPPDYNTVDRQFVAHIDAMTDEGNDSLSIHGSLEQFRVIFEKLLSETNAKIAEIEARQVEKEGERQKEAKEYDTKMDHDLRELEVNATI